METKLSSALIAEFIGTFALIFIGAGAGAIGIGGLVGVALAHGLVIVGFAYAYGHISGTEVLDVYAEAELGAGLVEIVLESGFVTFLVRDDDDDSPVLGFVAQLLGKGDLDAEAR